MIEYLNKAVTYNDLKGLQSSNSTYYGTDYTNFRTMCLGIAVFIVFIILFTILKLSLTTTKISIVTLTACFIIIIAGLVIPHYFKESIIINEELDKFDPQYRNVHITSKIDDISNGSVTSDQELRFEHKGENYYATIPSKIPVTTNDDVTIDIKEQIVNKNLNKHHLSQSINEPKNKVTIKHRDKTYHTTLNFTHINSNRT